MGAFIKYETSNARTFAINTTTSKITRPNRAINASDLFGAIIKIDGYSHLVVTVVEDTTTITAYIVVSGELGGMVATLTYTKGTDLFILGETPLTNVKINSFGKEVS